MKNGKIRRIRDNIELGEWKREGGISRRKVSGRAGENGWGLLGGGWVECRQKQYREIILFSAY